MKIKYRMIITVGLIVCICLSGCERSDAPVALEELPLNEADAKQEAEEEADRKEETERTASTQPVTVHVCGAVRHPGVYVLPAKSRVADAVLAAGDFMPDADTDYWNLALLLEDGQQVYVPAEDEELSLGREEASSEETKGISGEGLVNINTASEEQLKTLPGIGEVRARSIISYRDKNGPFSSVEDIKKVEGIKDGLYSQICDAICVK